MTDLHTHPGQLCTSGDRAVDLALELGRARVRLARYEAQEARIRALAAEWQSLEGYAWIFFDEACGVILAALDEPEAPT